MILYDGGAAGRQQPDNDQLIASDYTATIYWRLRKSPISALCAISQNLRLTPCKHTRTPSTLHSSKPGKPWSWTFYKAVRSRFFTSASLLNTLKMPVRFLPGPKNQFYFQGRPFRV